MAWMNNDNLYIKFGQEEAKQARAGEFRWHGPTTKIEADIIWNRLNAFGTVTFLSDTLRIPNGVLLVSAKLITIVPFTSGGSATLTLGLYDKDRTTAYDADGIDAAIALTAMDTVGETVTCDGALIGTILANNAQNLLTATVGTANYTAGQAKLEIEYLTPSPNPDV